MKTLSQFTALLLLFFTISCGGSAPESDDESMMEEAVEAVDEAMDEMEEEDDDEDKNEREISVSELPQVVQDAIAAQYADATIDEAEEITADDGVITYEVELEMGESEIEVIYSADGQFLGMEEEHDDDSDEDEDDESENHDGHDHD